MTDHPSDEDYRNLPGVGDGVNYNTVMSVVLFIKKYGVDSLPDRIKGDQQFVNLWDELHKEFHEGT